VNEEKEGGERIWLHHPKRETKTKEERRDRQYVLCDKRKREVTLRSGGHDSEWYNGKEGGQTSITKSSFSTRREGKRGGALYSLDVQKKKGAWSMGGKMNTGNPENKRRSTTSWVRKRRGKSLFVIQKRFHHHGTKEKNREGERETSRSKGGPLGVAQEQVSEKGRKRGKKIKRPQKIVSHQGTIDLVSPARTSYSEKRRKKKEKVFALVQKGTTSFPHKRAPNSSQM